MNEDVLMHGNKTVSNQSPQKKLFAKNTVGRSSAAPGMVAKEPDVLEGPRFVGHIFDFGKDPLAFMRRALKSKKPVVDFRVPGENISLITSAAMSHQILVKHYEDFVSLLHFDSWLVPLGQSCEHLLQSGCSLFELRSQALMRRMSSC